MPDISFNYNIHDIFSILIFQELDEIVTDHFGSGDVQTQPTNEVAELQEQPRADDVDEEEMTHLTGKKWK